MFAPADTWVSTEYLFRRDEDGDYWLVDNRGSVIRTRARTGVRRGRSTTRSGRIGAVDLAVTYARRSAGGRELAVTALTLASGRQRAAADLNEALAELPVGAAARHRPRGAGNEAERDLPAAAQPVAGGGHPEAVA